MNKIKYFLLKNKRLVIILVIALVCAIAIAVGVYAQITNKDVIKMEYSVKNENNYDELENEFEELFTNEIKIENTARKDINYDDILYTAYNINESKDNYSIEAKIPSFKIKHDVTNIINEEIYNNFAKTIINIVQNSNTNTTFNLDYIVYVNDNFLSLVIRCKYKDGKNPQRNIIKTYNYDLNTNQIISLEKLLEYKGLDRETVQNKIIEKIKNEKMKTESVVEQGYNVYVRNEEDEIYKIENTTNFFLGKDNYLYLVYAYGNNKFTSEMDLVIF